MPRDDKLILVAVDLHYIRECILNYALQLKFSRGGTAADYFGEESYARSIDRYA